MMNYVIESSSGSVTLKLTDTQWNLLNQRLNRVFIKKCSFESMINKIDMAKASSELEEVAEKNFICDVSDFSDLNVAAAKKALKIVVKCLYQFPKLRSRLCYIGSHLTYAKHITSLVNGDSTTLKDFNLHYICSEKSAKDLGKVVYGMVSEYIEHPEIFIAAAMQTCGFFDAIILDKNDYVGFSLMKLSQNMKRDVETGFHPKGCENLDSVIYHEIGHTIDNICDFVSSKEFLTYYKNLTKTDIQNGLSEYATTSAQEFIAEAFAEYMCSNNPRKIATDVYNLLVKKYDTIK